MKWFPKPSCILLPTHRPSPQSADGFRLTCVCLCAEHTYMYTLHRLTQTSAVHGNMNRVVGLVSSLRRASFVGEQPFVGAKRGWCLQSAPYLCGPHNKDNEIQLLSVTGEVHKDMQGPASSSQSLQRHWCWLYHFLIDPRKKAHFIVDAVIQSRFEYCGLTLNPFRNIPPWNFKFFGFPLLEQMPFILISQLRPNIKANQLWHTLSSIRTGCGTTS